MSVGTIDSFSFLWSQIEKDFNLNTWFPNVQSTITAIGAFYVARKSFNAVLNVLEAFDSAVISRWVSPKSEWSVKKYGPWAVVTGSSEGIGFNYALELAGRGINIVLISRSERNLKKAKVEIELQTDVSVEYIIADFSCPDQTSLYNHIAEKLASKSIGLLVNNVGVTYDYPDALLNIPNSKLWDMIYVNIGAATMMTHLLLPQMVERGHGGVVVLSAGSSTQITPQQTVYSATKRYLDYFIQGVAYEYRHSGVTFQCLVPFYVATTMTGYSDSVCSKSFFIPNGARYAQSAVRTLGRYSLTTGYLAHTLQWWVSQLVPAWLWMRVTDTLNDSLRAQILQRRRLRHPS